MKISHGKGISYLVPRQPTISATIPMSQEIAIVHRDFVQEIYLALECFKKSHMGKGSHFGHKVAVSWLCFGIPLDALRLF
jgi:hypothetical protein